MAHDKHTISPALNSAGLLQPKIMAFVKEGLSQVPVRLSPNEVFSYTIQAFIWYIPICKVNLAKCQYRVEVLLYTGFIELKSSRKGNGYDKEAPLEVLQKKLFRTAIQYMSISYLNDHLLILHGAEWMGGTADGPHYVVRSL